MKEIIEQCLVSVCRIDGAVARVVDGQRMLELLEAEPKAVDVPVVAGMLSALNGELSAARQEAVEFRQALVEERERSARLRAKNEELAAGVATIHKNLVNNLLNNPGDGPDGSGSAWVLRSIVSNTSPSASSMADVVTSLMGVKIAAPPQLAEAQRRLNELRGTIAAEVADGLAEDLSAERAKATKLHEQIAGLQDVYAAECSVSEGLRKELERLRETYVAECSVSDRLRASNNKAWEDATKMATDMGKLKDDLERGRKAVVAMGETIQELNRRVSEVDTERHRLKTALEQKTKDLQAALDSNEALSSDLAQCKRENKELETQNEKLLRVSSVDVAALSAAETRCTELSRQLKEEIQKNTKSTVEAMHGKLAHPMSEYMLFHVNERNAPLEGTKLLNALYELSV